MKTNIYKIKRDLETIEEFHLFCLELCFDEDSRSKLNFVSELPKDLRWRILNEFSTRVLTQKIHPVQEDDIHMASHKGYRAFFRREKNIVGKATNEATLDVLRRISSFLSKSGENNLPNLIKYHLNFPPSKQFQLKHKAKVNSSEECRSTS